ncbi:TPA: hypothetical protein NVH47_003451 [Enterobacter hormaechei subsp. xiangfangensis]|nr:hypothetical protein [Enterobacter hormaechei]HCJ7343725.1 hypothetical protein [Enterobacter hormaechei subsp. xiangfangensis]MBJ6422625.1 hypothetical protein [Enterobacter hormaechei]MBK4404137.1 hypothetical protein [Enterobacter hormaechei]SAA85670.1 Uncharacterised protein [Enterobacter hormaechei]SAB17354.1 Uncharacterised protein [Enterobacter hormaechei]
MKRNAAIALLIITAGATGASVYYDAGALSVVATLMTIGALANVINDFL